MSSQSFNSLFLLVAPLAILSVAFLYYGDRTLSCICKRVLRTIPVNVELFRIPVLEEGILSVSEHVPQSEDNSESRKNDVFSL
jgi:hypothetical protein